MAITQGDLEKLSTTEFVTFDIGHRYTEPAPEVHANSRRGYVSERRLIHAACESSRDAEQLTPLSIRALLQDRSLLDAIIQTMTSKGMYARNDITDLIRQEVSAARQDPAYRPRRR
ncbi:hypothetical protein JNJ66_03270 [Candidatus Saccharibacteria bacterium]|nr:hypothetical protein [Candidatus Saccharibacteria bacterium]